MPIKETVFPNSSNQIPIRIVSGGVAQDLSSVTRVTLEVYGQTVDSDISIDAFDWTTDGTQGIIYLKLGPYLLNETPGYVRAKLTIYDPKYTDGLVWEQSCYTPNIYLWVCDD